MARLSQQQENCIGVLLTSKSICEAASRLGVHYHTIRAWLKQEDFIKALAEARKEFISGGVASFQDILYCVADMLKKDLTHKQPKIRYQAAQLAVDVALKGTELMNLLDDVAMLKAKVKELGG
jgi:hypothetical protein